MATAHAPRTRRNFARLNKVLEVPNLIDIQRKSFAWLTDPKGGGLRETIDDISPIEDYTGNLAVQFGEFAFDEPVASLDPETAIVVMDYLRDINARDGITVVCSIHHLELAKRYAHRIVAMRRGGAGSPLSAWRRI